MKWNQTKKRIEALLAESVRGRVEFRTTSYRKTHDQVGRGWIAIDRAEILNMPSIDFEFELYRRDRERRRGFEEVEKELHNLNLFSQWDLQKALCEYLNLSIEDILSSDNPLIRAVGMLDGRVGKKRLLKLDVVSEHDLVQRLHSLRCVAENLIDQGGDLTARLAKRWVSFETGSACKASEEADNALANQQKSRNLRTLILHLYRQEVSRDNLATETARELFDGFQAADDPDTLLRVLLRLQRGSKLLRSPQHVRGVIAITRDVKNWVRSFDGWCPPSKNADRQFSSFARHLWARYDVPFFMDKAWFHGNVVHQKWFQHIGSGKSIRTAENLPVSLTKMMAHHFMTAPDAYSIEGALRWGQVQGLGGDSLLADALLETELTRDFREDDFWIGVLRFFIRNPMLDVLHVGPVIDYIRHQKYGNRIVFTEEGIAEEVGPECPNFSMKGRTVTSLLRAVEEWHGRLGREVKAGNLQWRRSGVADFAFVEGNRQAKNMKVWRIRELLTSQELIAEGKALRHCVASYARSCQAEKCSIWTMEVETGEGMEKLLTIEVDLSRKEIRQVRGRHNRLSVEKEREIIQRWAGREGLLESYRR